jgi:hypothetical protein
VHVAGRKFETPFERGPEDEGDRLLYRSENFTVRGAFELVILQGRELPGPATIGDFYGNPSAAAISHDESWCVMVGYGVVAYRLTPPWREYEYGITEPNDQWWEFGRQPENELWLARVRAFDGTAFVATTKPDKDWIVREFVVYAEERQIFASRSWEDTLGRQRAEQLRSYEGLRLESAVGEGERLRLLFGDDGNREVVVAGDLTVSPSIANPVRRSSGTGLTSPVSEALADFVGRTVKRAESPQDGSLDLSFDGSGSNSTRSGPGMNIRVSAGQTPGSWTASAPGGSLMSPGPEGWA